MAERKRRSRRSLQDRFDAWAAMDAARDLIAYQGRESQPSYIQRAIEMRLDRTRAGTERRARTAALESIKDAARGSRKRTPGRRALLHVAGLWGGQREKDEKEAQEEARWEFQQRAVQGRWEVGEGRRQDAAAFQQDQARRARNSKVFNDFRTLWENASKNPAMRKHWKELLGTYLGGLSPREREWLEPHMKGGPTDPQVMKQEFFDEKNPRVPRPERREGETDQDYNNRVAPWAAQRYRRDWQNKRYMLGAEAVGPLQEIIPYGEDEDKNQIFLRMPKDGIATFETRADAEFAAIEKSGGHFGKLDEKAPGHLQRSGWIERGLSTDVLNGNRKEVHTETYNWITGEKEIEKVDIGPRDLVREDLRMAVPKPAKGYADFYVRLLGGKKPDIVGTAEGDIGSRFYQIIHKFRVEQLKNISEKPTRRMDEALKEKLGGFWPGHTIRYKYDKGTVTTSKPFGENTVVEVIPGQPMYARKPGTEDKWMKIIWDSNSTAIWAIDPIEDRYQPLMTRKEHIEVHGVDLMTVGEYRDRFLRPIHQWALEYKGE